MKSDKNVEGKSMKAKIVYYRINPPSGIWWRSINPAIARHLRHKAENVGEIVVQK
jgi:hypothetical protein